jgi:hypothetical protein
MVATRTLKAVRRATVTTSAHDHRSRDFRHAHFEGRGLRSGDQHHAREGPGCAIAIENANPYGNAAAVFTQSGGQARQVMERASAGMIGVNIGVPVPREPFSFGGWNDSKFGTCDITGKSSIEFWTQLKKTTTKWMPNPEGKTNWMS